MGSGSQGGIYLRTGEDLERVVDTGTVAPGGSPPFTGFGIPFLEGSSIAIRTRRASESSILLATGKGLDIVADGNTPVPGGVSPFTFLGPPVLDGGSIAFSGLDVVQRAGIFSNLGGALDVVVDDQDLVPGTDSRFLSLGLVSADLGRLLFWGQDDRLERTGIYLRRGGEITTVVDYFTPVPGIGGSFSTLSLASLESGPLGDSVVFVGGRSQPTEADGLYFWSGGEIIKIVDTEDILDGRSVVSVRIRRQAFDNGRVCFSISFDDFSEAIYLAQLVMPSVVGVPAIGVVGTILLVLLLPLSGFCLLGQRRVWHPRHFSRPREPRIR